MGYFVEFMVVEFGKIDLVIGDKIVVCGVRLVNWIGWIGDYY